MLSNIGDAQALILSMLESFGVKTTTSSWQYNLTAICIMLCFAILVHLVARLMLHFKVTRLIRLTTNKMDDELVEHGVFRRLAHLAPGLALYLTKFVFIPSESVVFSTLSTFISLYLILAFYVVLHAALNAGEAIYNHSRLAKKAPITGFIQVAKLIFTLAMVFLIISLFLGKSPIYLLSGLTAIAAVLLLIFRDTILGFVAGIQIAANRMFNTGDWIEIPKLGVDGDIIQIGLNVVKVQNWDKTISTIPTYALTSDAVKNWRGMQESNGRRIKRAINIDLKSIAFASDADINEWRKLRLIKGYITNKEKEINDNLEQCKQSALDVLNSRKLTNIGTFRAYANAYINEHENVSENMTRMVRQLAPSELGLPIEIYCFSKEKDWVKYEHVQGEIFDHLLSILPLFKLQVYQRVTN